MVVVSRNTEIYIFSSCSQAILCGVLGFWLVVGLLGWLVLLMLWIRPNWRQETSAGNRGRKSVK